jgi:hypothetical protein
MWSARASASSRYCVVSRRVIPSPDHLAAARIQAGRRLVENEQLGLDDEARGEVDPAALTPGHRLHHLVPELPDVETVDEPVDDRGGRGPAVAAQAGHEDQVLPTGQVVLEGGELAGEAHDRADVVGLGDDVVPADRRRPRRRLRQRGEHPDDRGLARTVRSEQ